MLIQIVCYNVMQLNMWSDHKYDLISYSFLTYMYSMYIYGSLDIEKPKRLHYSKEFCSNIMFWNPFKMIFAVSTPVSTVHYE